MPKDEDEIQKQLSVLKAIIEPTLSEALCTDTYIDETNCGNLYTHIIYSNDEKTKIVKILADLGKNGTCAKAHLSAICELLTGIFKYIPSKDNRFKVFIMAAGHKCGPGTTCFDVMLRRLMTIDTRVKG